MRKRSKRRLSGPEQAAQIRDMFSRIAPAYDFLNHFLSLGLDLFWRRSAVEYLRQNGRLRVLDVCAGTGDFARQLIRRLPDAQIVIADFSRPMLSIARQRFSSNKQTGFAECDALQLPFPDRSFDVLVCAFGVRNLVDFEQGLREFHSVLRPGGELLILEFMGYRKGFPYRVFRFYFQRLLPWLGRLVSKHPTAYDYLPRSVERFVSMEQFSRQLHRTGFQIKQVRDYAFGVCTLYYAMKSPF